ncbi:MAG: hypothetical protein OEV59_04185 [Deltaproteobacteria bacterium]|nr:hypothetical protein [Deltaproteobacteria bacterium]
MKTRITVVEKGQLGVCIPEEFLLGLELAPGSDVEVVLDKKKKWILLRPLHGEDFLKHFKDSMDGMA